MNADRAQAQDPLTRKVLEVCSAVGVFIEYWGFKSVHGRVWTLLAMRRKALAQSEIAELLGVSRSLISGTIHELVKLGLVRPVGEGRHAPFEAILDVWPTVSEVLRSREWMIVESVRTALDAAIEEAEYLELKGEETPYDLARMKTLMHLSRTAQAFLKMLMKLRVSENAESLAAWIGRTAGVIKSLSSLG